VDSVTAYARGVLSGKHVAGGLVRLACERHVRDKRDGKARGLRFDAKEAERAIGFFDFLRHSKGEWAGQQFALEPWQKFIVGSIFGWRRADGTRRFRVAYNELSRKNGKSTLAAGVGLFATFFDNEGGAEGYVAATKRDQAKIVWSEAKRMVEASPDLRGRLMTQVANIHRLDSASKFEPLGADADSLDGLNIHCAIVDELHAHKTDEVWAKLDTATGARRQPLIFAITTAGFSRESVCWKQHDYSVRVLEGVVEDDSLFAYIATTDPGDAWDDPKTWAKANPNFGVSVKLDDLERKAARAREIPAEQNWFRRMHLCEWTESSTRWLDLKTWDECGEPFDETELLGRECYGGLDLARVRDVSAFVLVFPPEEEGGRWHTMQRYWIPEMDITERSRRDHAPYAAWRAAGRVTATEGNTTDFRFIQSEVISLANKYDIRAIGYDRVFAGEIIQGLQDEGLRLLDYGQGFTDMAAPVAEIERLVIGRELRHGGDPVLRWMASNAVVRSDPMGNKRIDKERSTEKVDGMVALAMGVGVTQKIWSPSGGPQFFTFGGEP
jgi:phage terminase large subunit-like protein